MYDCHKGLSCMGVACSGHELVSQDGAIYGCHKGLSRIDVTRGSHIRVSRGVVMYRWCRYNFLLWGGGGYCSGHVLAVETCVTVTWVMCGCHGHMGDVRLSHGYSFTVTWVLFHCQRVMCVALTWVM